MGAIRNFHIHTSSREAMPENPEQAIPETEENNNSPILPTGHINENPQDNHKKINDIEYYVNVVQ
jgi:regulator of sirC expression with transglutaminase-like and TPR domain